MKLLVVSSMLLAITGCQTLEERMASRTGCKKDTINVQQTSWSPVHQNFLVKCGSENKEYLCTDTSFSKTCSEKAADQGDNTAKNAAPAKSAKPTKEAKNAINTKAATQVTK